jgi:hypothetical protein
MVRSSSVFIATGLKGRSYLIPTGKVTAVQHS